MQLFGITQSVQDNDTLQSLCTMFTCSAIKVKTHERYEKEILCKRCQSEPLACYAWRQQT